MPDAKALLLDLVAVIPDGNKSAVFCAEEGGVEAQPVRIAPCQDDVPDGCPIPGGSPTCSNADR
jgi:hypothetical protein